MVDRAQWDEEDRLRAWFSADAAGPEDGGFTARVMDRIGVRIRRRRLVLAVAIAAGAGIAAWPLGQLLLQLSDGLRAAAAVVGGAEWLAQHKPVFLGIVLAFVTPVFAALIED